MRLARSAAAKAGVRVWLADQTLNWFPDGLWTLELAPIASEWPRNAFWDVYPLAAYLAAKSGGPRDRLADFACSEFPIAAPCAMACDAVPDALAAAG